MWTRRNRVPRCGDADRISECVVTHATPATASPVSLDRPTARASVPPTGHETTPLSGAHSTLPRLAFQDGVGISPTEVLARPRGVGFHRLDVASPTDFAVSRQIRLEETTVGGRRNGSTASADSPVVALANSATANQLEVSTRSPSNVRGRWPMVTCWWPSGLSAQSARIGFKSTSAMQARMAAPSTSRFMPNRDSLVRDTASCGASVFSRSRRRGSLVLARARSTLRVFSLTHFVQLNRDDPVARSGRAATLLAGSERYRLRRLVPGKASRKCDGLAPSGPADSALPGVGGSGTRLSVKIVLTERAEPLSVLAATHLQR